MLRAVIAGLTLLAVMWVLHLLGERRSAQPSVTQAKSVAKASFSQQPSSQEAEKPKETGQAGDAREVREYPFATMDNSCLDGEVADLSGCTRMLSGGKAMGYVLHVTEGQSLRISVEPMYADFDVSFAFFKEGNCIVGRDAAGKGQSERANVSHLAAGDYQLWVGGYDGDCGPFLLTVTDQPPSLAQIQHATAFEGRNGTVLRWKSFGEVDLEQYQIYRVAGDSRQRIAVLRAHGSPAGFSDYRFMDRSRLPGVGYELEIVARDGRSERVEIES
ncbi:MAG TPA: hypothetical protein VGL38_06375 [bacterium]|jgi:hypothetical protein